jgi:hypothetical protein
MNSMPPCRRFSTPKSAHGRNRPKSWRRFTARTPRTPAIDQAQIDALDLAWRAEIGTSATPTIDPVLQSVAADFLRSRVDASGGRITEVFIMDRHGLNVAASAMTSDMWQGDEAKFTETYSIGAGAVHFSEVELDESTQRYQAQISRHHRRSVLGRADRRHDRRRRRRGASVIAAATS